MRNRKFFIQKLYAHSRLAFVLFTGFLFVYAFFFFKGMDMTVFAYNSMFVSDRPAKTASAYAVKVNGALVPTSSKLWWKKDFLESSLIGFSEFLENEQSTYLQRYLNTEIKDPVTKQFLLSRITHQQVEPMRVIAHYLSMAGYPMQPKDTIEIVKYHLQFSGDAVQKTDSTIIFIKKSR